MKIKNIILLSGTLLLGAASLTSCSDDESYDIDGIDYARVYFESAGSVTDGVVLKTPVGYTTSFSDKLIVKSTSPVTSSTDVTISVDSSKVAEFNEANNTNYKPLPDGVLTISSTRATIDANASQSEDTLSVTLDESKLTTLTDTCGYLAPIVISSTNNDELHVSSNAAVRYMHINYMETNSLINSEATDIVGTLGDGTQWTCLSAENLDKDKFQDMFTGNSWYRRWSLLDVSATSASFVVDLGETKELDGFNLTGGYGTITNVYAEFSTDNSTWKEIGNTSDSKCVEKYDYSTWTEYIEYVLYSPVKCRYLRFTVTVNPDAWSHYLRTLQLYFE